MPQAILAKIVPRLEKTTVPSGAVASSVKRRQTVVSHGGCP